jgi:hypothetical protein
MQPSELTKASFASYPPLAQAFAVEHLAVLQQLPMVLAPLVLREVIAYDVRFPAERRTLDDQMIYLASLAGAERSRLLAGFASLTISKELNTTDWVHRPQQFSEALTAHLWATGQINAFHAAADQYAAAWRKAKPDPLPAMPRLSIVLIGGGGESGASTYPLFRKLRAHGVYFPHVDPTDGLSAVLKTVAERAESHPAAYAHWYIDGGQAAPLDSASVARVSYSELADTRTAILRRMQGVITSGQGGPEALRTLLAETRPEDIGMSAKSGDAVMNHFKLSILTEGSGTQIFSTTFAQWSAREALRRAQPVTLLVRFAPRQRQQPMSELLSGSHVENELDPAGSLVDGDMAAYYTWLNQQRLSGAEQSAFLAWHEGQNQAVAISPALPQGTTSPTSLSMSQVLASLA